MSDIKSMLSKMGGRGDAVSNGAASPPKKKTAAKGTIEDTYQKVTQLEHILLRPDTYIGSVEQVTEPMWVYDSQQNCIIHKEITYTPGLYKIFDEILVNAADNKQRDAKMDCIKIEIKPEENYISVWNNGQGIPVVMHKDENMFVPTMIFGHLLTSSNYNDEEEKVTGGRNGYGAKLCNIFSTKFTVETAAKKFKSKFKQTWGANMSKASDPKIGEFAGDDYTKISFNPDLEKFKMNSLDEDIVSLMSRRAYDVAASVKGVKVFLNGTRVPVKSFKDYVEMYTKGKEDEQGNPLKIAYESSGPRWEIAVTQSDGHFLQMSFVNSIATTKGGRHVDAVVKAISTQVIAMVNKKNIKGMKLAPAQVKNYLWVFVNCLIVNPTFDSQTKENMTLQKKSFGSTFTLSDKFYQQISKSGLVDTILSWSQLKAKSKLSAKDGKKQCKLKGIAKLEDANEAGTKNSHKCTLILTEGDSAKTLAVSGLGVIGRDLYGVFPLRGKLLNVREATHKQILENAEINNLIKILGLQYKKKYNTPEDMKSLRYGKVMIMTDQDQDGSHIKGLLINFIHHNWPELLRRDFLEEFITPIVKARKKNEVISFFSLPEFEEWKSNTPNNHTYSIKYYKGLGTSSSVEAKEYFTNMARHRICFKYQGQQDDDHIVLAFSKKHVEHRKEWLTNFMVESRRRKELGLQERYLYRENTRFVSYTDFVNLELVLFSNADNIRSIPCLVDGFKPGQRKVLFTCLKRNDKKEVKVAQLAGSVAEHSAYHHGEVSLCMTIVNLAQNYVGSNNINVLEPRGQFGTRLAGGKDSASPRYIFTKMSPLTRMIFHQHDDALLKHEYDDNQKIEPVWYIPVIPMVLVNGAEGIGTGWMTKIPNYNPRDLVANLRALLDKEDPKQLIPWYKNFKGTIETYEENRYVVSGEIAIIEHDKLEITELPVGTWTQNYKENVLEPMLHGSEKIKATIADYKEYNTDTTVKFVVTPLPNQLEIMLKEGLHKIFKLQTVINTSSMCVFDEMGCLKRYDSVMDIQQEFFKLRLKMYQKRKDNLEGTLEAEASKLSNQARFILEKCNGQIVVENKKRKFIIEELIKKGYHADPVKAWREKNAEEQDEEDKPEDEAEEDKHEKSSDFKNFDYLLGMAMWVLTEERKNELLRQRDNKLSELETLRRKTNADLWREDLDLFCKKLEEVEAKEADEEKGVIKKEAGKKAVSKKKVNNLMEVMPSPQAKRVAPTISDDMKKKLAVSLKSKDSRTKKLLKKDSITEEKDEFDLMTQSSKTLIDKLGSPEEVEQRAKIKGKKGDGLKQTKLNFSKLADKTNGSPKKRKKPLKLTMDTDDEENFSNSDVEIITSPIERSSSRRAAAAKPVKYQLSDEEEDDDAFKSDEELELKPAKSLESSPVKTTTISDSESEKEQPPSRFETSEDMFDSLVGRKKSDESPPKRAASPQEDAKKQTKRKKILASTNSDSDIISNSDSEKSKPKKAPPKKRVQKKKKTQSSDEDEDSPIAKKPMKSRKKVSSDDEDFVPSQASGRRKAATKTTKYFDDDDDDSDLS